MCLAKMVAFTTSLPLYYIYVRGKSDFSGLKTPHFCKKIKKIKKIKKVVAIKNFYVIIVNAAKRSGGVVG